jgi:murein DD-endopeptidase MepM/ murein hydrolase activator NlpD
MPARRLLVPFLLGALSMLALVVLVVWAVPRWLPAGGLVIRIGPSAPAAPPGAPARASAAHDSSPSPTATLPNAPPAGPDTQLILPDVPTVGPAPAAPAGPAAAAGQLLVPVQGVEPARLVDTYAQARSQGRRHDAIDIMAPRGTPVLAAAGGTVLKLFRSVRGGTTLYELAPDRRTIYYYAHLDRYAAGMAEGRDLRQGDVLGYVGDTGNSGAGNYHLHFEISTTTDPKRYWAGTPQNPYPLLRRGVSR